METFEAAIDNVPVVSRALGGLNLTQEQTDALLQLYAAGRTGIQIERDTRSRLQGPTIYQLSRAGTALTRAVGAGPRDAIIWFGTTRTSRGHEYCVMRPQMRAALEQLGWVKRAGREDDWLQELVAAAADVAA